jgi:hypothetical protein
MVVHLLVFLVALIAVAAVLVGRGQRLMGWIIFGFALLLFLYLLDLLTRLTSAEHLTRILPYIPL